MVAGAGVVWGTASVSWTAALPRRARAYDSVADFGPAPADIPVVSQQVCSVQGQAGQLKQRLALLQVLPPAFVSLSGCSTMHVYCNALNRLVGASHLPK